jgi:hypothetical protein
MLFALLRLGKIHARLFLPNNSERAMSNPNNSGDLDERRKLLKLLDRLAAVDRLATPKCLPDVIAGQWLHGDADTRRKIEDAIDRMPKKSN